MSGRIAENIVQFGRVLRASGLPVGPATVVDAIRAVEAAGIASRDDLYWTLHAVFVSKREERAVFDEAFRSFWRSRQLVERMLALLSPMATMPAAEAPRAAASRVAAAMQPPSGRDGGDEQTELRAEAASAAERLAKRDFAQMTADEIAEAKARIARFAFGDDWMATRRPVAASRGRIDPRRTLRSGLRTGGHLLLPRFREKAEIRPPIVALLDISGSMSRYSRIILHFLHALGEKRRVDTFLFGTRLSNVTRQLRMKDPDEALAAVADAVPDWSGGTRIATALNEFNRLWSRRVLGRGAVVLLVTDGLERDVDTDLSAAMDRLHRSSRRLIWLNPLLRFDGFEARARGIRAMLPHVDEFQPVHSLEAIGDLVAALGGGRSGTGDPRHYLKAA